MDLKKFNGSFEGSRTTSYSASSTVPAAYIDIQENSFEEQSFHEQVNAFHDQMLKELGLSLPRPHNRLGMLLSDDYNLNQTADFSDKMEWSEQQKEIWMRILLHR